MKASLAAAVLILAASPAPAAGGAVPSPAALREAAAYSAASRGVSLVVMVDGRVVFEDYPNGGGPGQAHELASGTKSFWGVAAAAAVADGLMTFDEKVAATLPEWRRDPWKAEVTLRQLLSLTSGLEGGRVARPAPYLEAVAQPLSAPPGRRFSYGQVPFQLFGEVLRRKLAPRGEDPLAYLDRRVLRPIGARHGSWRRGADGNPHLPSGASLTARDWARFGELVRLGGMWEGKEVVPRRLLDECFEGTSANPMYGLTWWLNRPIAEALARTIRPLRGATDVRHGAPGLPSDLVFAGGAGKQRLYVSRERKLVVARQADGILEALLTGDRTGFTDTGFLSRLLGTSPPGAAPAPPSQDLR